MGYVGGNTGEYVRRHNPFAFFSDVVNDATQKQNLVPVTQLAIDQASGNIPALSYIVPNLLDDAHDGTLAEADTWLKNNIDPIVTSAAFQNDGLLIITFDEGSDSDNTHGGGHIPTILVSSKIPAGFQSGVFYQHQNVLKLMCDALGVQACPGASATAADMADFFSSH